jgi:hypothetical protein
VAIVEILSTLVLHCSFDQERILDFESCLHSSDPFQCLVNYSRASLRDYYL